MDLQKEIRQFVIRNNFVVIFVVPEHIANYVLDLVFVFLHQNLQNLNNLVFLKLFIAVLVEVGKDPQNLSTNSIGQAVATKCKRTLHRHSHIWLLTTHCRLFGCFIDLELLADPFLYDGF